MVYSAKRRTRKEWDDEWGDLNKEGHIWWLGSGKAGWEDVMGTNKWGWICEYLLLFEDIVFFP